MNNLPTTDPHKETWKEFHQGVRDQCLKTHCNQGPGVMSMDFGPDGGNMVRIETCGSGCASCIKRLLNERGPTAVTSTTNIEIAAYGNPVESFTYPGRPSPTPSPQDTPHIVSEEVAPLTSAAAA